MTVLLLALAFQAFEASARNDAAPIRTPAETPHLHSFDPSRPPASLVSVVRTHWTMGTALRVEVWAENRERALAATEAVFAAVDSIDGLLSTWDPESELSQVMARPWATPVQPSAPLLALLDEAFAWQVKTRGAFSPTIGSLVEAWDLRGAGQRPQQGELEEAIRDASTGSVIVDRASGTFRRVRPGVKFDAGAFGKGAALRAAEASLAAAGVGYAILDFGGQILQRSLGPTGQTSPNLARSFPVAHPAIRDSVVGMLDVHNRSVATSGNSERFTVLDGETLGHVLDPRTGFPTHSWGSATVISSDPVAADVLSTALLVRGPNARLSTSPPVLLLIETKDGLCARMNQEMRALVQLVPPVALCSTTPGPTTSSDLSNRNHE